MGGLRVGDEHFRRCRARVVYVNLRAPLRAQHDAVRGLFSNWVTTAAAAALVYPPFRQKGDDTSELNSTNPPQRLVETATALKTLSAVVVHVEFLS